MQAARNGCIYYLIFGALLWVALSLGVSDEVGGVLFVIGLLVLLVLFARWARLGLKRSHNTHGFKLCPRCGFAVRNFATLCPQCRLSIAPRYNEDELEGRGNKTAQKVRGWIDRASKPRR